MDKGKTPVNDASLATDAYPTIADLLGGSSITSTKLNSSSNFLQWSADIITFLLSRKKLHHIEALPSPDNTWLCEDAQVRSCL